MLKPPPPPPDAIELIRNLEVCVGKQGRCRWVGNRACVFTSMDQRGPTVLLVAYPTWPTIQHGQDSFGQVGRSVKLDHQAAFRSFWRLQTQEESHSHNLKVHTSRRLHPTTSMWYDGNGYNRHQWTSHRAPIALSAVSARFPLSLFQRGWQPGTSSQCEQRQHLCECGNSGGLMMEIVRSCASLVIQMVWKMPGYSQVQTSNLQWKSHK